MLAIYIICISIVIIFVFNVMYGALFLLLLDFGINDEHNFYLYKKIFLILLSKAIYD